MGYDINIKLTPYLDIKKFKHIDIPRVKRVCPNHPTFKAKDEKFCPYCASEIINQEYMEAQVLTPHKVLQKAKLEEDFLCSAEYLDGILYPNHYPPEDISIKEENSGSFNLYDRKELMDKQIAWFKEKYAKHISALNEAYDEENVQVCWGLLHYWA
jgi:RNA polymerase subunit RPABC4/transcription elongation factor Spt4